MKSTPKRKVKSSSVLPEAKIRKAIKKAVMKVKKKRENKKYECEKCHDTGCIRTNNDMTPAEECDCKFKY